MRPTDPLPTRALRVVVADDDHVTRAIVERAMTLWGFDVRLADDGPGAWQLLTSVPRPALAIIDWMMPGIDGIDLCRRIRSDRTLAAMYVLLLTGRDSRADLVAGLDAGADDYMVKPIDPDELRARVAVGRRVATLQQQLAEQVGELQATRDHLARLVSTDVLTQLYTRRWWFELAAAEFSRCRRYARGFSLMVLDLDFFKNVNDTFGHDAGDQLLRTVADMLRAESRRSDLVGRLGGEEFALLAPETSVEAAQTVASRIAEACRRLIVTVPAGDVRCTCSIGLSAMALDDEDLESVLRRADGAMYDAKRTGRDCWRSR